MPKSRATPFLTRRVLMAVAEPVGKRIAGASVEMVDADRRTLTKADVDVPAGFVRQPVAALAGAVRVNVRDADRTRLVSVVPANRSDAPYQLALVGVGVPALPLRRDQLDPAMAEVVAAQLAAWVDDLADQIAG